MGVFIRVAGLVIMLILGIFLGIDFAEKNIQQVQGTEGAPRSIQIVPRNGKLEISVLGQSLETINPIEHIDERKVAAVTEQAQEGVDHIVTLGNRIGSSLKNMTRTVIDALTSWLQ